VERSAAPPAPCRTRQKTSSISEFEVPQKNEETMNRMMENVRYRCRPNRSAKNAVIGRKTTLLRM
jgi:hypothetical protein